MRRTLPDFLPPVAIAPRPSLLEVMIPLATVTAVVGGGVEVMAGDPIDPVRLPAIRGQLRSWWRALGQESNASDLFDAESHVWGGVGAPDPDHPTEEPKARKSLVGLDVQVQNPGRELAAGWHTRLDDGRFRALPRWNDGDWIGYGLFPLQRTNKERQEAFRNGEGRLGTKAVREEVRFTLTLRVDAPRPKDNGSPSPMPDLGRILAALWAWVHIGGLGARTSRGFGALAIAETEKHKVEVIGAEALVSDWAALFRPCPAERLPDRLREILRLADRGSAAKGSETGWPVLHGVTFLVGGAEHSAHDAHRSLLGALREFRQGLDLGRERGSDSPFGRSFWPEADALRRLAINELGARFRAHPPRGAKATAAAAPRAAFGLPLNIGFKDREDEVANGRVVVDDTHDRYSSPVRLCPILCQGGRAVPVVLVLRQGPPRQVTLVLDGEVRRGQHPTATAEVTSAAGALNPIAKLLGGAKPPGDAVAAWCDWLTTYRGFTKL